MFTSELEELKGMVAEAPLLRGAYQVFAGFVAHLQGRREVAVGLFEDAEGVVTGPPPAAAGNGSTYSAYYCRFLLETGQPRRAFDRALLIFRWRRQRAWQTANDTVSAYARDMRVLGLAALALGEHELAGGLLQRQLEMLRPTGEQLCLPGALAARARYFAAAGDLPAAAADLSEALDTALNTGMGMAQWETYLNLAALHLQSADGSRAQAYLNEARRIPGMAAYKHRTPEIQQLDRDIDRLCSGETQPNVRRQTARGQGSRFGA